MSYFKATENAAIFTLARLGFNARNREELNAKYSRLRRKRIIIAGHLKHEKVVSCAWTAILNSRRENGL
jgi:hypothetical protein